nr:type IV pili methyl-accepting chemotaxis transducer N-terminal domain-containing protein [SAR324 cluster bacterium]
MRINSIKFKVIGLVGLFVVLLLIVVGTTSYIIVSQSADAKVIDIAGRQRMLTQKMSKEAFALIFALKSRSAFEEQRKNLLETISLFDTSLKALKDGGVTLGTDGKELNLPESSTEANNQFNYLSGLWSTFKDSINLTALDSIDVSSSDIQIAVSEIEKVNSTLLLQSNKATVMLKEESEKKTSHLILVLISSLISTLLLTAVSLRFSDRSIIRPLENLTEGAELIGRGNLEHKVGTDAIDEVGQLSRTFDQMIENLNASRSELQKEIIVRKKAEEQISTSLKEKEVLLQEIHHRVKNNMTVITSLLYLQSKRTDDEKFKEMANDSISRISSMALIHEKLYRSKDLGKIDFSLYLRDLIQDIFSSNNKCTGKISLKTDLESMFL